MSIMRIISMMGIEARVWWEGIVLVNVVCFKVVKDVKLVVGVVFQRTYKTGA